MNDMIDEVKRVVLALEETGDVSIDDDAHNIAQSVSYAMCADKRGAHYTGEWSCEEVEEWVMSAVGNIRRDRE